MGKNNDVKWLGQKYGRLTIIGFERKHPPLRGWDWIVKCDCGNMKQVSPTDVRSGKTKSCGCYHDEVCRERAVKFEHSVYEYKRLYSIYNGIKKRCYNSHEVRYKDYGGRGIRMCDEWLDSSTGFDKFVDWALSHGYREDLSIDRINPDGNYCPENCQWATTKAQNINKRGTLLVEYNGEKIPLLTLCERAKVSYDTVHDRIYKRGWDIERAIKTPSQRIS